MPPRNAIGGAVAGCAHGLRGSNTVSPSPLKQEIAEAARTGTLGVLALDLALRPPGEMVSLADAAANAGLSLEEATMLWRALGFAVPADGSVRLTSAEATMLGVLVGLGREVV